MDFDTGMGLYQQWEEDGTLPFRVWTSFYWNGPSVDPMPAVRQMRERYNSELVKGWKLKVNLDGGDDKHNAVYVEAYSDRDDGWTGEPIIPQDVLNRAMLQADAEGIHLFCQCACSDRPSGCRAVSSTHWSDRRACPSGEENPP